MSRPQRKCSKGVAFFEKSTEGAQLRTQYRRTTAGGNGLFERQAERRGGWNTAIEGAGTRGSGRKGKWISLKIPQGLEFILRPPMKKTTNEPKVDTRTVEKRGLGKNHVSARHWGGEGLKTEGFRGCGI